MNKVIKNAVSGALVATAIAMAAPAAAAESYLSAGAAVSDVSNYSNLSNGMSAVVNYGIKLPAVHKYFSIEGEVTKSISNPDYSNGLYHAEYDYATAAAYAVFTIPVWDKLSVRARGGLLYNKWKYQTNQNITYFVPGFGFVLYNLGAEGSDIGVSGGAGVVYDFNNNLNFAADLTAVTSDIVHATATVQIKF